MTQDRVDHDQAFKGLIREFFREFMELFLPGEAEQIDFTRMEFLDKETFSDSRRGRKHMMDLVVKVGLKRGGEEFVLVHNEFESTRPADREFQARMFGYFCQLHLRYGLPVIPVALFSDDRRWRRPLRPVYEVRFHGRTYNRFEFHLIKLKHLRWQDFLKSNNALAFALMAKMDYDPQQKVRLKADFLRWILKAKTKPSRTSILVEFVDQYCPLHEDEQEAFLELTGGNKDYEEVATVMTSFEKRGLEKGLKQGIERGIEQGIERGKIKGRLEGKLEGLMETLERILEKRFTRVSAADKKALRQAATLAALQQAIDTALDAGSVKEVIASMRKR